MNNFMTYAPSGITR